MIKIEIKIDKTLLITQIDHFAENNQLKRQEIFTFHKGRLVACEEKEGNGGSFYQKTFQNTPYGDPERETLFGNLTGDAENESYSIERIYRESSPHLLLTERHENGLTYRYTYLSNSNLLTAKYTQDRDAILQKEESPVTLTIAWAISLK